MFNFRSEDKTEKEAYCFLVRHYISKFCKLKDDSATFSCQLSKGHAAAENVKLDIKVILIVLDEFDT